MMDGAERRERMVERITNQFVAEYGFDFAGADHRKEIIRLIVGYDLPDDNAEDVANKIQALFAPLGGRARAAIMGAVRIGMLEATRGLIWCWHVMSPSMRETLEAHWGFSGVKPERP